MGLRKTRCALIAGAAFALCIAAPAAASAAPTNAFVTDEGSGQVDQLTIGTGQTLSFTGSVSSSTAPTAEAVTPDGKYLYVPDSSGNTVSQYSIGASGSLTPLSSPTASAGPDPYQIAVSPDGKNAYVASFGGHVDPATVTEYSIAADGTLQVIGTLTGFSYAEGVSVSPDGSSVYVSDPGAGAAGEIFEYNRNSDGTLTPKSTASIPYTAGYVPDGEFTPNGKYFYVSGANGGINEFSVGSGGVLSPLPVSSVTGGSFYGIVVSPDGQNAYASGCSTSGPGGSVYSYSVGAGGELTPLTPPTVSATGCGMPWMTASGASLYAPDAQQSVDQFDVAPSGALSPKSPASVTDSSASYLWAITIPPDQGPVAAFTSKAGKAGKATTFNASGSSDSDGTVVSYQWSFGDGTSKTTTTPTVSHTYKKAGSHTVTLTVTDDSGCSTTQVFTGQTAYCNGTPAATVSHTVKIAAATQPLKLTVSPRSAKAGKRTCYALKATSKGRGVRKVTIKLAGHKATTSASGKAKLCLTLKKGTYKARASKKGYVAATTRVHVSAASPAFTG